MINLFNTKETNEDIEQLIEDIALWHYGKGIVNGSTDQKQIGKLCEEFSELITSCAAGESPIDDIGDMIVVLINIAERNGLTLKGCLDHAYEEISKRTGKTVDGIFIKEK